MGHSRQDPGSVLQELWQLPGEVVGTDHGHQAVGHGDEERPEARGPLLEIAGTVEVVTTVGKKRRHEPRHCRGGHHAKPYEAYIVDRVGVMGEVELAVEPGVCATEGVGGVHLLVEDEAPQRRYPPGNVRPPAAGGDE